MADYRNSSAQWERLLWLAKHEGGPWAPIGPEVRTARRLLAQGLIKHDPQGGLRCYSLTPKGWEALKGVVHP